MNREQVYSMILVFLLKPLGGERLTAYVFSADIGVGQPLGRDKYPHQPDALLKCAPGSIRIASADRRILMALIMNRRMGAAEPVFSGMIAHTIVMDMINTGRCYFWPGGTPPLRLGKEIKAALIWTKPDAVGNCRPTFDLDAESVILPTAPLLAVENGGACRPVACGLPDDLACRWQRAGLLAPASARAFVEQRIAEYPRVALPPPPHIREKQLDDYNPTPALLISRRDARSEDAALLLHLTIQYGPRAILPGAPGDRVRFMEKDRMLSVPRRPEHEAAACRRLEEFGLARHVESGADLFASQSESLAFTLPPSAMRTWSDILGGLLPQLESEGWAVRHDAKCRLLAVGDDDWYADFTATARGWFTFESGVRLGDQKINLLPFIHRFLQERRDWPEQRICEALSVPEMPVAAGDCVALVPGARLRAMVQQLFELYSARGLDGKSHLVITELRAAEIARQVSGANWQPAPALAKLVNSLHGRMIVKPQKAPKGMRAVLRPYQEHGFGWLLFLEKHRLGGILADDMGLGKTVQAMALLQHAKNNHRLDLPALVVAPTSVLPNWRNEFRRFAPGLEVKLMHGADRHVHWDDISKASVVLTSYALLHRDAAFYDQHEFSFVILDEAQFIKNSNAKSTQAAWRIKGRMRLCMTGTPVENHLGELWSLMQFALPGWLGTEPGFECTFRDPIERDGNEAVRGMLGRRIKPLVLRRAKSVVEADLPPKNEMRQIIPMSDAQLDLYQTVRMAMTERVRDEMRAKGLARSRIVVLDALLKLREICCDPRLRDPKRAYHIPGDSGKLAWLVETLPEMVAEGRRILLFSQFTRMLDLIKEQLAILKLPYVEIRGNTRDRETPVEQFQAGVVPIFLISLKAGGTGLNLTAADVVIHYDPWWNPAVEAQATDRAHRIGQQRPVFVYKLITDGTVEERILELQARKRALSDVVNESSGAGLAFSKAELDQLLAPIRA